jgi:hypothetical protein
LGKERKRRIPERRLNRMSLFFMGQILRENRDFFNGEITFGETGNGGAKDVGIIPSDILIEALTVLKLNDF